MYLCTGGVGTQVELADMLDRQFAFSHQGVHIIVLVCFLPVAKIHRGEYFALKIQQKSVLNSFKVQKKLK